MPTINQLIRKGRKTGQEIADAYNGAVSAKARHMPQRYDYIPQEAELGVA